MYLSNPTLATDETYVPGLSREYIAETFGLPVEDVAKLGSAENPFGPSPMAHDAVSAALSQMDIYRIGRPNRCAKRSQRNMAIDPMK